LIVAPDFGWTDARVLAPLACGTIFGGAFLWLEAHSGSPMLPLHLFRSRTFSSVNLLTFLLYAALAVAFFFLPFALIQVNGYSALLAGAAFLPFTVIMGVLSRWSGGLLDQFGARLPLVVGPAVAAIGFILLSFAVRDGAYWAFLVALAVLGLGMVSAVAPLTTTVINAVPQDQTGVASGVNNAIASLASLLAVAIFGAVALGIYDRSLDQELAQTPAVAGLRQAVDAARGQFAAAIANGADDAARTIARTSLARSVEIMMLSAAALAVCSAVSGMLLPRQTTERR
jgi:predicted MFS family arabinose efflux permease